MRIEVCAPLFYTPGWTAFRIFIHSSEGNKCTPALILSRIVVLGLSVSARRARAWTRLLLSPQTATRLTPRPPSRPWSRQRRRNVGAAPIPIQTARTLWDAPHATPPGERRAPRAEEAAVIRHRSPSADSLKSPLHCPSSSSTSRRVRDPSSSSRLNARFLPKRSFKGSGKVAPSYKSTLNLV